MGVDPSELRLEWMNLLEVATNYMLAAEELIDGLQGNLGIRPGPVTEEVVLEVARRVDAYAVARKAFITYARDRQAELA